MFGRYLFASWMDHCSQRAEITGSTPVECPEGVVNENATALQKFFWPIVKRMWMAS
jgi:hypothetical protein